MTKRESETVPLTSGSSRWQAAIGSSTYVVLMGVGAALAFVKLFALARVLPREDFGRYVFLAALIQYGAPIVSVGILDGMARRLPIMLGQGDVDAANRLRNVCLGAVVVLAAAAAGLALTGGTIAGMVVGPGTATRVFLVTADTLAFIWYSFGLRDLRSRLHARSFAALAATRAAADLVLSVLLARAAGINGVLSSETIVLAVLGFITSRWLLPTTRPAFGDWSLVGRTMRDGTLIVLGGVAANTALLGDRLILGSLLPAVTYSSYAAHVVVISGALIVANIVVQYVYPKILTSYGQHGSAQAVTRDVLRYGAMLAVVAAAGALLLPWFTRIAAPRLFPGYAIDPTLITLLYIGGVIEVSNLLPLVVIAIGALRSFILVQAIVGLGVVITFAVLARRVVWLPAFGLVFIAGRLAVLAGSATILWLNRQQRAVVDPDRGQDPVVVAPA
jgi:O-antigen/teichoic acid export membrane protein